VLSARLEVAYLAERFGLNVPEGNSYDTLAGYILHYTGDVPAQGAVLEEGPFRITVAQLDHGRIDLVNLLVTDTERGFVH
jgi:CBS domain containing-hemolysin-like protein